MHALFRGSVRHVASRLEAGDLIDTLSETFRYRIGYRASAGEIRSWQRSLPVLAADLLDAGLEHVEMLVECPLPLSSKRADVVLCGVHPSSGESSYVVVELKQWTNASPLDNTEDVVVSSDFPNERLHPVRQVQNYCEYMSDFIASFRGETELLAGLAYLHNASDDSVNGLFDYPMSQQGQLFTGSSRSRLQEFLRSRLAPAPGVDAADELTNAAVKPSKQLLDLAAEEVQHREQFVLLDEQQLAYSMVSRAVTRAYRENSKQVVIITGGPGSGKSVIALSLLGELSRQRRSVLHATGSSAFTMTMRRMAGKRAPRVQQLFKYFHQFIDAEKNGLDVIISDEAHRIRETSTTRYTPAAKRSDRAQVEELIDAARVPVFLLDEHQVVRPGERGSVDYIEEAAARLGCEVVRIPLDGQFRCGGSRLYEDWVLRLLGLKEGGPTAWTGDADFEVAVADNPSEMESRLEKFVDTEYTSRISAGFCWDWSKPEADVLLDDVRIGGWHKPWNNPKDTKVGGAPGRPYWASDPAGFGQVGCIYTAQGFEYDYSGVIFGDDLVWRGDRWVGQRDKSRDSQVRWAEPEAFTRAVKNTYKVLLTRGMRGTMIYSTDPETQELFRSLVG